MAAKKIGVKVEEFGLGYPPRLFGKKIGETIYSLNWLPFGGFVRLFGEESQVSSKKKEVSSKQNRAFFNRSKIERSIILVAGVAMNFLLGVAVISYLFTQGVLVPTDRVMVEQVLVNTPAEQAGIKPADQIVSVNGTRVKTSQELITLTKQNAGKTVKLLINRCQREVRSKEVKNQGIKEFNNNCDLFTLSLVPRIKYPANEGSMGVSISNLVLKTYSWWQAPYYGTIEAFKMSWFIAKGVVLVVWQLITVHAVPKDVAGPIGIYKVTGQALQFGGLMGVLQLLALLSLNLGVINILPIPVLDGGRFFLIFVEAVVGKKRVLKIEKISQSIGMTVILALIVLITISDLSKLSLIQNLLKRFNVGF